MRTSQTESRRQREETEKAKKAEKTHRMQKSSAQRLSSDEDEEEDEEEEEEEEGTTTTPTSSINTSSATVPTSSNNEQDDDDDSNETDDDEWWKTKAAAEVARDKQVQEARRRSSGGFQGGRSPQQLSDPTRSGIGSIQFNPALIMVETRCVICMGIIKKARTVMQCLHRFCADCIETSLRKNNHECPTCRTHIQSRRSLRYDESFDELITSIYGDVQSYEQEEQDALNEAEILIEFRKQHEKRIKEQRKIAQDIRESHNNNVTNYTGDERVDTLKLKRKYTKRSSIWEERKKKKEKETETTTTKNTNVNKAVDEATNRSFLKSVSSFNRSKQQQTLSKQAQLLKTATALAQKKDVVDKPVKTVGPVRPCDPTRPETDQQQQKRVSKQIVNKVTNTKAGIKTNANAVQAVKPTTTTATKTFQQKKGKKSEVNKQEFVSNPKPPPFLIPIERQELAESNGTLRRPRQRSSLWRPIHAPVVVVLIPSTFMLPYIRATTSIDPQGSPIESIFPKYLVCPNKMQVRHLRTILGEKLRRQQGLSYDMAKRRTQEDKGRVDDVHHYPLLKFPDRSLNSRSSFGGVNDFHKSIIPHDDEFIVDLYSSMWNEGSELTLTYTVTNRAWRIVCEKRGWRTQQF